MGPCAIMCVREPEVLESREKRYVEADLPIEISNELAKSEPPPVHPVPQPVESTDPPLLQTEIEQQVPQAEAKMSNKSRFYREKHDVSDELEGEAGQQGEGGQKVERADVLGKRTQKKDEPCQDMLGSTEFSEVSITDSLINSNGNTRTTNKHTELTSQASKTIQKVQELRGATPADQSLIDSTRQYTQPTQLPASVTFTNQASYQGQWLLGLPHGQGRMTTPESVSEVMREGITRQQSSFGNVYVGQFQRGMFEGEGSLVSECGLTYRGKWAGGRREGFGVEEWKNGEKYEGEWRGNKKNGYGELYFEDGSYYKGSFVNNELQGEGEYSWYCKRTYNGGWLHNEMSGKGCLVWDNGSKYEGQFRHDKMHGKGRQVTSEGVMFEGEWQNGRKTGIIFQTLPNGQKKRGEWYFGKVIRYIDEERRSHRISKISTLSQ